MTALRVALHQANPVVGDLLGNAAQVLDAAQRASEAGADVLVTGEMALSGYPIEDLAAQPSFLVAATAAVVDLAAELERRGLGGLPVIVGHPDGPHDRRGPGTGVGPIARNCASVLHRGRVVARYAKHHLPNYGVFDEYRVFSPGTERLVLDLEIDDGGVRSVTPVAADGAPHDARDIVRGPDHDARYARLAVLICEDLWVDHGPVLAVRDAGVDVLLVLNASPFERDKDEVRLPLVRRRVAEIRAAVAYANIVGGQDDLVFDGGSFVVSSDGGLLARSSQFVEDLLLVDVPVAQSAGDSEQPDRRSPVAREPRSGIEMVVEEPRSGVSKPTSATPPSPLEQLWNALVLGLRDYVDKNGFPSVILGLSGGIDSAVCAAIAADAIGADRVYGVGMPSRWSSDHSRSDADELAERLGLHYAVEPIADLVQPFEEQLALDGVAAENVQARARGVLLMARSNQHGHLVLTTGNKTEIAVGYSTIYGDSVGGFAPIKDVPKSLVWELARWRNSAALGRGESPPIPENSIIKPPSAELRPGQVDQDSLPPYELLDAILEGYVERRLGRSDLVAAGFDEEIVERIAGLVDRAEWKRRQGAIGPRISGMAFGRDRRLPITVRRTGRTGG